MYYCGIKLVGKDAVIVKTYTSTGACTLNIKWEV